MTKKSLMDNPCKSLKLLSSQLLFTLPFACLANSTSLEAAKQNFSIMLLVT